MNSHEDNWFRLASLGDQVLTIFCKQPNHAIGTQNQTDLYVHCTLKCTQKLTAKFTKTNTKV